MDKLRFHKTLYPKIALIKAAYNFTDRAYIHLDMDGEYYLVHLVPKSGAEEISENDFTQEILAQTVRHEIYTQTKDIRQLLLARALATSVLSVSDNLYNNDAEGEFSEEDILKDWFVENEGTHR